MWVKASPHGSQKNKFRRVVVFCCLPPVVPSSFFLRIGNEGNVSSVSRMRSTAIGPSRAQLRMLHILDQGGKLIFSSWPYPKFNLPTSFSSDEAWQFHQVTARIIVNRGWVELRAFNAKRGEYIITRPGHALTEEMCRCIRGWWIKGERGRPVQDTQTETLGQRLLCRRCGRRVRCVSKKTPQHGASRWHGRWGPVCDQHP